MDTSIIQEIIFLGHSKTVPHWQEWKIILSSSNLQSSIEQVISSLARIIILEQKSLNEENVAKCRNPQEELSFSRIIGIDEYFFQSLGIDEIKSILKECPNIVIKMIYNSVSYSISISKLLKSHFFDQMLFGGFKREKLTCVSGQLQLILSNDPDPLIDSYLQALEVKNPDDFKKWSLSSLVLSYLGANYCEHEEIEEFFVQQISLKEINSKEEIQETIEQLSLLDNYDESDAIKRVKVQLLNICVKYDLFSNSDPIINVFYKIYAQKIESLEFIHEKNGGFQKIDQKKLIETLL
ncbi:MAG: hypothetical protein QRY74_05700 [Chlamydia sp.]